MAIRTELLPLSSCTGRVLAEDLRADRDFPPFHRVMMDGMAINSKHFKGNGSEILIEGMQAAGQEPLTLINLENGIEIMTGAVLPGGCDAVIPYEQLDIKDQLAKVECDAPKPYQHVHLQGTDKLKGDLLIPKGMKIGPAEIGVAATIGKSHLSVYALPKIAILSTGDELVEVDQSPLPHQIRRSNVHMLRSLVEEEIGPAEIYHLNDELEEVRNLLGSLLAKNDLVLLSGGVSKGKFDLIPQVLDELQVERHFHGVKQRPGKPFWFGTRRDVHVFAFPGNPVSTFMCANRYLIPWWKQSLGLKQDQPYAILSENFTFKPSLQYFLQVALSHSSDGKLLAGPISGQGSGDLANLCLVDGFLELPDHRSEFNAGEAFPIWKFR